MRGRAPDERAGPRPSSTPYRRGDVVAKVRALDAKRDAGMVEAAGEAPTVGDWLEHWLENIAARKVRARTLESYRSTIRLHLRPGHRSSPA